MSGRQFKEALKSYAWLEATVYDQQVGVEEDTEEDGYNEDGDTDNEDDTDDGDTDNEDGDTDNKDDNYN